MRIPKNATPAFFQRQADKGTFDPGQWIRWVRRENQNAEERNPKLYKKLMDDLRRKMMADDPTLLDGPPIYMQMRGVD